MSTVTSTCESSKVVPKYHTPRTNIYKKEQHPKIIALTTKCARCVRDRHDSKQLGPAHAPQAVVFTSVLCNVTMEILEGFLEPIRFFTQEVNKPPRWGGEFVYPHELEFYSTNFVKLLEFH